MAVSPLPVHTITGFLGSGKSTLLNVLVQQETMADSAIIINEFGEIAIDHALVETSIDNIILLHSGCICCSLRGDLVDTLQELDQQVTNGKLPAFNRVLLETTGLADPGPVLQTLLTEKLLKQRYAAGLVVTMVDMVHAVQHHKHHAEFAKQVAVADKILTTKSDLASLAQKAQVTALIRQINPGAEISDVTDGQIDSTQLLGNIELDNDFRTERLNQWTLASKMTAAASYDIHLEDVKAHYLRESAPVSWQNTWRWLQSVVSLRGSQILRIKGILNIDNEPMPIAIHAVHHVLHPPIRLPRWPDNDRETRIVFITRGLELDNLNVALRNAHRALSVI
jgi:G3E family GTPase